MILPLKFPNICRRIRLPLQIALLGSPEGTPGLHQKLIESPLQYLQMILIWLLASALLKVRLSDSRDNLPDAIAKFTILAEVDVSPATKHPRIFVSPIEFSDTTCPSGGGCISKFKSEINSAARFTDGGVLRSNRRTCWDPSWKFNRIPSPPGCSDMDSMRRWSSFAPRETATLSIFCESWSSDI